MNKYSKPPWRIEDHDSNIYTILNANGKAIIKVDDVDEQAYCDACLIAAAPDLYESCCPDLINGVATDIESEYGETSIVRDLRYYAQKQRDAMSKAGGERNE